MAELSHEKVLIREQKEMSRLQKLYDRLPYKGYLIVLLFILAIVNLLDNYASEIVGSVQSLIVNDLFVKGLGMTVAKAFQTHTYITTVLTICTLFSAFYKGLADRYGRRLYLILSTFGMGFGLFVIFLSSNIASYVTGRIILSFFVATDIQILYITEVAPQNRRGLYLSIAGFIANLGLLLIPMMRSTFITEAGTGWRNLFLIPGIIGLVLSISIIFFARESKVWIERRLAVLTTPLEVREEQKKQTKQDVSKTGVYQAVKDMFKNNQLRAIFWSLLVFSAATMFIISYTEPILQNGNYTEAQITQFYVAYPFAAAIITLINGPIGDKFGRKKTAVLFAFITFAGYLMFLLGVKASWNPYLLGSLFGSALYSFWATYNMINLMLMESAPTRIRGSAIGAMLIVALFVGIFTTIILGTLIGMGLDMGWTSLIGATSFSSVGLLILIFFTKETAGQELE